MIKVTVAEDNRNLAVAIKDKLALFPNVQLLNIASNGKELIKAVSTKTPDVILMDIMMPVMDGVEATQKIKHLIPGIKIIMLTIFDDEEKIFESILAGASGFLLKDESPEKIHQALEEAMEDGAPMSPSIAKKALTLIRGHVKKNHKTGNYFQLTERELEILELMSAGDNYQKIADKIFVSPKTVRKHIENTYKKLQAHSKIEALKIARDNKLIKGF